MADGIQSLRSMTLEQLEMEYDRNAPHVQLGIDFYRREIEWRHQNKQAGRVEKLTEDMASLTHEMRDMTSDIRKMTRWVIALTILTAILTTIALVK